MLSHNGNMTMTKAVVVRAILILALVPAWQSAEAGSSVAARQSRTVTAVNARDIVPHTVIVKLRAGSTVASGGLSKAPESLPSTFAGSGAVSMRQMFPRPVQLQKRVFDDAGLSRIFLLELKSDRNPATVANELSQLPDVEYSEPKYYQHLCDTPNDSLIISQTTVFTQLNAFNGWSIAKGSSSVVIADIDGGTHWRHEDLLGNVHVNPGEDLNHNGVFDSGDLNGIDDDGNEYVDDLVGWNFANGTNDPSGLASAPGSYLHGTATASHYGAVTNNGKGMAGSSWNCAIMPICTASPTSDEVIEFGYEGIVYALDNGASVINCSWGRLGGYSQFEQDVITAAVNAGALVVAAAGNDGVNSDLSPHYPSCYTGVLPVGATYSTSDALASFSNYGALVKVYAPGVNILSAYSGGGYGNGGSGTSYSSPLVAGLAGILRGVHPTWTPDQIAAQIRSTADPIDAVNSSLAGSLGRGRVNFARALSESRAALNISSVSLRTTAGNGIFLPGDTIALSLKLKNVMFITAAGCGITVTTSDTSLHAINPNASLGDVAAGAEVTVPPLTFRVGSVSTTHQAQLRAVWSYNSTDQDAAVFTPMLFPVTPLWLLQLDGAPGSLFSVCAAGRDVVWASGGNGSGTSPVVVVSTNGGSTWRDATGSLQNVDLYCINSLDATRAWVGSSDGRIFATSDGGSVWAEQTYPGRQSAFINGITMFPDGTGYAMGDPPGDGQFVVLKTTNFGATWTHVASEPGLSSAEAGWNNSFFWIDAQHGWFGTNMNRVWRTTDGGASWSSATTGSTNSFGVSFRDASTGLAVHGSGTIARSTNGGQSWSLVATPTGSQMTGVALIPGTSSAWVTDDVSPYRTRTGGTLWNAEETYPISGSITHVSLADSTRGWAVTSYGEILCYDPMAYTTGIDQPVQLPAAFVLDQNYPNPFNPTTKIGVGVSGLGFREVRLAVYDILGREVAVLMDARKEPGRYEVMFDGSRLASGVYIYRLEAGNSVISKKMLLMK
jgi:photosystem II stability/assembly factor-like uncharacterized protein